MERQVLAAAGVSEALLRTAVIEAGRLGVSVDAALLAARALDEDTLYRMLAQYFGAPFITHDVDIKSDIDFSAAADAGMAPLCKGDLDAPSSSGAGPRPRWLAAPRGRTIVALAAMPDKRALAITTPRRFGVFLRAASGENIARYAAQTVAGRDPRLSARFGPCRYEQSAAALVLLAAICLVVATPQPIIPVLLCALSLLFVAAVVTRLFAAAHALEPPPTSPILSDQDLPEYTIIVALLREADVVAALVSALERLNYPHAKLDIKFVVEYEDADTFQALARTIPGVEYEIIIAPRGKPRTKPRALDIALPFARGQLLTVFDAEDVPEPDQLRRAAEYFHRAPRSLACLQARLAIDNSGDNWLAALYAIDYAALFEVINPGLAALGLPILLGGTSNHFRTDVLREIGGWDAWNVTEDADLGLRLARYNLRVETLDSRTYEEAPNTISLYLHQRSRWLKGWMQTAYVHLRHPLTLLRNIGPTGFIVALSCFVSGVIGPLLWPYFLIGLIYNIQNGSLFHPIGWAQMVASTLSLWLASFGFIAVLWPIWLGMRRQGLSKLWMYLALMPLWYVLLHIAAWIAVLDLRRNPFGWSKTRHGLARARHRPETQG